MAKAKRPDPRRDARRRQLRRAAARPRGLNQVVAHNLQLIRLWHRLTEGNRPPKLLEPYLGKRWSKANFSAAERSVACERIRQFDADEIVAFAKAFEVPVAWFFLPPVPRA